jgi:hypothetical protein
MEETMPAINLAVDHGRTVTEARDCLRSAVGQTCGRFGKLVRRVDWSVDGDAVTVVGVGFQIDMRVDAKQVHVVGTLPGLGGVLAGPVAAGFRQIVDRVFRKTLPGA